VQPIAASPRYDRAVRAVADLLSRLRLELVFAGSVARAVYLGDRVVSGSIDVIALMNSQQKNQLAMMASNRGFRVEREEIEASEELDLVPLNFVDSEGDVRVHVLLASNALYGRMMADAVPAEVGDVPIRVPRIEDFALLLQMNNDITALEQVVEAPRFDRAYYNRKLTSIGLRELVVPE
jgi:hypothetical protein